MAKNQTPRSLVIARIMGAQFEEQRLSGPGEPRQYVCEIKVYHTKGGMNFYTGRSNPAGYGLSISQHWEGGFSRGFSLDGRSNPAVLLEAGDRFNASRLRKLAAAVRCGQGAILETLGKMYQQLQASYPECEFPDVASDDAWREVLTAAEPTAA